VSAAKIGDKNGGWKGDKAGYHALHDWLRQHYPKARVCDECGRPDGRTEFALIHGRTYSRNRDDYRELCCPCHRRYDLGGKTLSPERVAKAAAGRRRRYELDREAGTMPRGESNGRAKLTEADVATIRLLHAQGVPATDLARDYEVCAAAIRKVVNRKTWVHVP
jgi:hypothetical protein